MIYLLHITNNYTLQMLCGAPHNICDDEGKLTGRPLNRALRDEDSKEVYDIVAGPFFVCSCKEPRYTSLSVEQQRRYLNLYKWPETFFNINGKITAVPVKPRDRGEAR